MKKSYRTIDLKKMYIQLIMVINYTTGYYKKQHQRQKKKKMKMNKKKKKKKKRKKKKKKKIYKYAFIDYILFLTFVSFSFLLRF